MTDIAAETLGRDEAVERITRVKASVDTIREDVLALWKGRAWVPLGYSDWSRLCEAEFGALILPREQRREIVADLTEDMSTRAIASALGVDQKTVVNDLNATEEISSVDPDRTVTGVNGKTYKARTATVTNTTTHTINADTGEIIDAEAAVIDYATDSDAYRDAVLRKRLTLHIKHMGPPEQMEPEEAAALDLDDTHMYLLDAKVRRLSDWMDRFYKARNQQSALRIVKGN